ncbi:cytochrome c peroxidase, partial [Marinobacter sp.]
AELAGKGKTLFNDTSLSSNGLSCATCHTDGAGYNDTFENEYPHYVAMGQNDFGMEEVHLDEMVQICMVAPMAAEPLAWDSDELAALTEYMRGEQEKFRNR